MLADDKDVVRRRLALARYPRRSAAHVAAHPEHNPEVLEDCPRCGGRGKVCDETQPGIAILEECADCRGAGTTYRLVRYFTNDLPSESAQLDSSGWLTCPACRYRFSTADHRAWTGLRHMRCGQRIVIDAVAAP